jgi:hypothetical protein
MASIDTIAMAPNNILLIFLLVPDIAKRRF